MEPKTWNLATACWHNHNPEHGLAVGVSVLRPSGKKYPWWHGTSPYPYVEGSRDMWPRSNWPAFREWMALPSVAERRNAYEQRLNERKDAIEAYLDSMTESYPAVRLTLLCHEMPGQRCHRHWLADWLKREFAVQVPEVGPDDAPSDAQALPLF